MCPGSDSVYRAGRLAALMVCSLAFVLATSCAGRAAESGPCSNLPSSRLEVYDIKTAPVDTQATDPDQLDRRAAADTASSSHTMMVTTHNVAVVFEIAHQIFPVDGAQFCDAPSVLRLGIGFSNRAAYLARPAAEDNCLRAALLAHEADHQRADANALHRLLNEKQDYIVTAVTALKRTASPSPEIAIARWEAGLRVVLESVKQDFVTEEPQVNASVDTSTALQKIENACGGKLKQIESRSSHEL